MSVCRPVTATVMFNRNAGKINLNRPIRKMYPQIQRHPYHCSHGFTTKMKTVNDRRMTVCEMTLPRKVAQNHLDLGFLNFWHWVGFAPEDYPWPPNCFLLNVDYIY